MRFAKSTSATESGFLAAGITVSIVAIVSVLFNWIAG
jgi:Flp pilus assembly pilin Flp